MKFVQVGRLFFWGVTDRVVTVEKAVTVVMQERGRRALFDATQRLGANYREKAGLIKCVPVPVPEAGLYVDYVINDDSGGSRANCFSSDCQQYLICSLIYTIDGARRMAGGRREKPGITVVV